MKWISMGLDVDSIKWADRKRGRQFTGRWTVLAVLALVLTSSHIAMAGNWADVENRDTNWTYSTAAAPSDFAVGALPVFTNPLEEAEYNALVQALQAHGGHRERTAEALGVSRRTLQYKLKRFGLVRPYQNG